MSAQVEEIVASSQSLKDLAGILEQSIAMFKVDSAENDLVEASKSTGEGVQNTIPAETNPAAAGQHEAAVSEPGVHMS
jgi:hypothetical protein